MDKALAFANDNKTSRFDEEFHEVRKKSKELLEEAKRKVEEMIENG